MRLNFVFIFIISIIFIPPLNAFNFGASDEDKSFCRNVASSEKNEFSAKLSYKACLKERKLIKSDLNKQKILDQKNKRIEEAKSKDRKRIYSKYCKKFMVKNNKYNWSLGSDPDIFPFGEKRYIDNMDIILEEILERLRKYDSIESTYYFVSRLKQNSGYSGINQDVHMSKCDEIFQ